MSGKARVVAAGVPVDTLLLECFATRTSEIVIAQAQAWKADLIVLGTHGRRGIGRLLVGSDAEQIVRGASVPVLLTRAEEVAAAAPVDGEPPTVETSAKEFATATV
jgi:nucleotide-binding universal stress UspA family protein